MADNLEMNYGLLRRAPRRDLRTAVPLAAPFTIYIEPTNTCNFKCSYCPVHFDDYVERSGGHSKLSIADCARILDEIRTLGRLRTLNFYMLGEPYANRDLPTFIEMAKARDVADRVVVTTNATLLNEEMARRTIASGLDYLRVSIYGATQDRHAEVTSSKIPLDRIYENVRRLKALRDEAGSRTPHIYVKMIDAGPHENARFAARFEPVCDELHIEPAMNWNLAPDESDLSGLGDQLSRGLQSTALKRACPFPFYTLVINADMRVTVCCVDWEKKTTIGNLASQTLADIWRGDALREFQLTHLRGERHSIEACRSCTYLHAAPDDIDGLDADDYRRRTAR